MSTLRRFIAGAVCPACGGLDKLFLREEGAQRVCECVTCGFRDSLDRAGATAGQREPSADEAQPVRLIDP